VGAVGVDDSGLLFFTQHGNFHLSKYSPQNCVPGSVDCPQNEALGRFLHIRVLKYHITSHFTCKEGILFFF
jgi:hypothetical protein